MEMIRYTDEELAAIVADGVRSSNTEWSSKIADQRQVAYEYYFGERPAVPQKNSSDHVSRDVFDAVESLREKLLRVFTSGRHIVRFEPTSEDDVEAAMARTRYVEAVAMKKNPGYSLLQTAFQDALLQKVCCFKRYYKTEIIKSPQSFSGPEEDVQAAMAQGLEVTAIESVQESVVPMPTQLGMVGVPVRTVTGTAIRDDDRSRVVIEVVPPEDVFIDGNATSTDTARFIAIRWRKTKAELIAEGFPADVVGDISQADSLTDDTIDMARRSYDATFSDTATSGERELITGYEAYLYLDGETPSDQDPGEAMLWQVISCGSTVLAKEPVREMPFRFWSPIHLAHRPIGLSIADVTQDIQRTNSNVTRGILDNVYRVNTGLRIANLSILRNARDLIDNPIGGVIDSPDTSAVNVIPQPAISSATGMLLELMASEKEMRTGDSRLSKGLENQTVLSHQNAEGMIDRLMDASNERVLGMARAFAETCWRPLMLDLYRLGYESNYAVDMEVGGSYQSFSPQMIPYSEDCTVTVALTPEAGTQRAAMLMSLNAALSADQELGPLYGTKERYALMAQVFDLLGQPNWLADPASEEGQQRLQQAQQMKQMAMQMQMQETMAKVQKDQAEAMQKRDGLQLDVVAKASDQALKEAQFQWQKLMDVKEAELEKTQKRPVAIGDRKVRQAG